MNRIEIAENRVNDMKAARTEFVSKYEAATETSQKVLYKRLAEQLTDTIEELQQEIGKALTH